MAYLYMSNTHLLQLLVDEVRIPRSQVKRRQSKELGHIFYGSVFFCGDGRNLSQDGSRCCRGNRCQVHESECWGEGDLEPTWGRCLAFYNKYLHHGYHICHEAAEEIFQRCFCYPGVPPAATAAAAFDKPTSKTWMAWREISAVKTSWIHPSWPI